MSKRVFLGVGHGGSDPGASSNGFREKDMTLVMALECKRDLERHGVIVGMSRNKDENDPVAEEVRECNAFNADLAVDIHVNAGGGDGFEVFYYSKGGTSLKLAKNLESEVIKIGQNSRGCKTKLMSNGKDYYAFIRDTNPPAVILEAVFIDNAKDMDIANNVEKQKKFGVAYAKGILKTLGITYKEIKPPTPSGGEVYYRVIAGSYKNKDNAQNTVNSLKSKGHNAFIATFTKDSVLYYRAVAGSYIDRVNADNQVLKLKKDGFAAFIEIFKK